LKGFKEVRDGFTNGFVIVYQIDHLS